MRGCAGAVVGTRVCPNRVQIGLNRATSLGITRLHNCVLDSYASHTRGSIFAGAWCRRAVVGTTCGVCRAICSRSLASLMNHQSIDKLC